MKTNRRNFLKSIGKICAVLPFVGSSPAVAQSGTFKGQRKAPMCATEVAERFHKRPGFKLGEDGLKEAFVYGGKLFRVFPGYFDEGYVMMSIREGRYENTRMITKFEFADIQFRHFNCEIMLKDMEKFRKNGSNL